MAAQSLFNSIDEQHIAKLSFEYIPIELATKNAVLNPDSIDINIITDNIITYIVDTLNTKDIYKLYNKLHQISKNLDSSVAAPDNIITPIKNLLEHNNIRNYVYTNFIQHIDPDIFKFVFTITGLQPPNLPNGYTIYTFVANNYEILQYLYATNPGILALYMHYGELSCKLEHPGEVIKYVKNLVHNEEIPESKYWKELTKQSPSNIIEFLRTFSLDVNRFFYLLHSIISGITLTQDFYRTLAHLTVSPHHSFTFTQLLLKATQTTPLEELRRQSVDISDYLRRNNPEAPITSKTWRGLLKKSDIWHRNNVTAFNLQSHDPDIKQCWNSLITTPTKFTDADVLITPLTNSLDLYKESDEMEHCVRTYVDKCKNGNSRIFKIEPITNTEEGDRGTVEIILNSMRDGWHVNQVRGLHNRSLSKTTDLAAEHLSHEYTKLWTADPEHTHWIEDIKKEN